jgi:hypothetical protein
LSADARSKRVVIFITEATIRPILESILKSVKSGSEINDVILVGHHELSNFGFGGTFRIFKPPMLLED